jgi:hypothetical protein
MQTIEEQFASNSLRASKSWRVCIFGYARGKVKWLAGLEYVRHAASDFAQESRLHRLTGFRSAL